VADRGFEEVIKLGEEITEYADSLPPVAGLQIEYGGDIFSEFELPASEIYGVLAAVIILIVAFGSVLAMGLPIGIALFGIFIAVGPAQLPTKFSDAENNESTSFLPGDAESTKALTAAEVLSLSILLLLGGTETTTNLLGSIMVTFLEQPDDVTKVRHDPSLIPQLIEEGLRYHSPVQALFRQTTQAVEIAGTTIPANATIMSLLASANRDARKFPDPERFDLTRNADGHVALGHGVHFCLGAPLARLEAKVALEALLQRLPSFRATAQPVTWIDSFFVRGPRTLPLAFAEV